MCVCICIYVYIYIYINTHTLTHTHTLTDTHGVHRQSDANILQVFRIATSDRISCLCQKRVSLTGMITDRFRDMMVTVIYS